jgi:hypothetical protein
MLGTGPARYCWIAVMWRSALRIPDPFLEFCQNKRGILGNNWELKYFFKDFQYLEIDFLVLRVVCGSSMFFSLIYFLGGGWKLMFHITFRLTLLQRSLGPQKEFLLWACNMTGWWFGTCFIFPYIGNNNPNWLFFFQKGRYTTNQMTSHVLR